MRISHIRSVFVVPFFFRVLSAATIESHSTGIVETALHDNGFVLLRLILFFGISLEW